MIFVVGNSRSGTTMMARMLGRHSKIHAFGELHIIERLVTPSNMGGGITKEEATKIVGTIISIEKNGFFCKHNLLENSDEIASVLSEIEQSPAGGFDVLKVFESALLYETKKNSKEIPCEQTPRNLFYLDEIFNEFPCARVVYMVRDPRDVMLSQKKKWQRRFLGAANIPVREAIRAWVNYHPYTISRLWVANERYVSRFVHHERLLQVKFEQLLEDPESEIRRVCKHLGVDFEKDMLQVPVIGSSLGRDNPGRVGVDATRKGGWRRGGLTVEELVICQKVSGDEMRGRGYLNEELSPSAIKMLVLWMSLPLKTTLAILLNMRRTRNMWESIKRRLSA